MAWSREEGEGLVLLPGEAGSRAPPLGVAVQALYLPRSTHHGAAGATGADLACRAGKDLPFRAVDAGQHPGSVAGAIGVGGGAAPAAVLFGVIDVEVRVGVGGLHALVARTAGR